MLGERVGVLRRDRVVLVDRRVLGRKGRSGKKKPGTVSDDICTNRETPIRTAASDRLNTLSRLLANTSCGGFWVGSGIAAQCTTASGR